MPDVHGDEEVVVAAPALFPIDDVLELEGLGQPPREQAHAIGQYDVYLRGRREAAMSWVIAYADMYASGSACL